MTDTAHRPDQLHRPRPQHRPAPPPGEFSPTDKGALLFGRYAFPPNDLGNSDPDGFVGEEKAELLHWESVKPCSTVWLGGCKQPINFYSLFSLLSLSLS